MKKFSGRSRAVFLLLAALAVILYTVRVCAVNLSYDKPKLIIYEKGDVCELGDFSYCVRTKELLTQLELQKRYGATPIQNYETESVLLVGIDITYNGAEESARPDMDITFESKAWRNGAITQWTYQINPESTYIARNETKRIYIATSVAKITFAKRHWNSITHRSYQIVLSTYPDLIVMRCD